MKNKLFLFFIFFFSSAHLFAADEMASSGPNILTKIAILGTIAILPYAVMLLTSYLKIVIVLGLLRNAIGVQQSPPSQVINGIALLMSIYVMYPVGVKMYEAIEPDVKAKAPTEFFSDVSATFIIDMIDKGKEPLKDFLNANTQKDHKTKFLKLAQKSFAKTGQSPKTSNVKEGDFIVLIPSFITSQLKSAFEIGVLIYLPFFVIDLVTSNVLLAMGMMMLSPLTIALPLKLLLIVMVDGWTVIIQGLVLSFAKHH